MNFRLNKKLQGKWIENQIIFLRPLFIMVAILYLGFLIPRIEQDGVSLRDFVPTNAVITAIVLYIVNATYDYLRKLRGK